jgi:hypothetical protein
MHNPMGAGGQWAGLFKQMMDFLAGQSDSLNMFQWMRDLSSISPMYGPTQGQQDAQEVCSTIWMLFVSH